MEKFYQYFYKNNIPVDIISPDSDLSSYSLVIAPNLIMSKDDTVQRLYEFVKEGGYLVMDFRAGAKEWDNRMLPLTLPGKYSELLGIEIRDYGVIISDEAVGIRLEGKSKKYEGRHWYDVISLKEAEPVAFYMDDYYSGTPAVTCNKYFKGKAYYFGTEIDETLMKEIFSSVCSELEVEPAIGIVEKGIEVIKRSGNGKEYAFIINHNPKVKKILLNNDYYDLLSEKKLQNEIELEGYGVLVLE
jgi:beta-galactosidase